MTNVTPAIQSAAGGELSPRGFGRTDLSKYAVSHRVLENMVPLLIGATTRRPGFRMITEVADSAVKGRLLPFEFSTVQTYQIEAGDKRFRFLTNQAPITVPNAGAAVTNGDFTSDIAGWTDLSGAGSSIAHDAAQGRLSLTSNGTTSAQAEQSVATTTPGVLHVLTAKVFGVAGDALTLRIGTTSGGQEILADRALEPGEHTIEFTPGASPFFVGFLHGSGKTLQVDDVALLDDQPFELVTLYDAADLAKIRITQSRDILYLAHPGYALRKLSRFGNLSWSLTELAFQDGPYLPENTDDTMTLQPSATTGLGITITAAGHSPFAPTDVGRLVRIKNGADWGWAIITGFTSPTVVTADVRGDFAAATATREWRLGLFSDTTGHPAAATFHEERFAVAGSRSRPDRADLSKTADFETFTPGGNDDDAIAVVIASDQVNSILWLVSSDLLFAGTPGGIARIFTDRLDAVLTPTNKQAKFSIRLQAEDLMPVVPERSILYVARHGRRVRDLTFDFDTDGYKGLDRTILADHVTLSGIAEMAFQEEPWRLLWAARQDGQLVSLTYEPQENVLAWARHRLGGDGIVESVSVIPGADRDELWIIARFTIDGATRRYVLLLEKHLDDGDPQEDAFYVDAGLTYSGPPVTIISGLDHLESMTVKVMVDGAAHPDRVVTGGRIALNAPASKVHVGLGYRWIEQPNRPDAGSRQGTAIGKRKRVAELTIQMHRTLGVAIGPSVATAKELDFRTTEDLMDTAIPLFSGERTATFAGDWDDGGDVVLTNDGVFPATLTMRVPRMEVEDG